jgi:hypothetical protein
MQDSRKLQGSRCFVGKDDWQSGEFEPGGSSRSMGETEMIAKGIMFTSGSLWLPHR